MARERVFGKVRLTREERETERRIQEATKDRPSLEELERRLGPLKPFNTLDELEASRFRAAVGHKIGVAREDAGLTREGLAKLVGTDLDDISGLECGAKDVTLETLARVLRALKFKVTMEPPEPAEPAEKEPVPDAAQT